MSFRGFDNPQDPEGIVVHGDNCNLDGEFTACGIAVEEWDISGHEIEHVNSPITCEQCIQTIEHIYESFKKVKGKWRQVK